MAQTCLACRARKMRCDGGTPVCGPCSRARKPVECGYSTATTAQRKTNLLQKGAACLPCRRKKKKCDAERPHCKTCRVAGKTEECEYEEEARQSLATALLLRTRELEERLARYEAQERHMSQPPPMPTVESLELDLPQDLLQTVMSSAFAITDDEVASATTSQASAVTSDNSSPGESFASLDNFTRSLLTDITLRPTAGTGLICQNTYQLRTLFLNHQTQAGFYLRDSKWQAVKDGDFSGTVVHRSVVHLAQLVGSMLWKRHHKTDVFLISEDAELRSILNALEDPPDSATLVMIYTLLAWCFLFQRQLEVGREYLMKASQVVTIQNLQLTPPCMDAMLVLGEPDEDTKEFLTSMAQLLYMDKAAVMVLGMSTLLDAEYDRQLKTLSFMQPWLTKHSVVLMRCKSISILEEAMRLSRMRAEALAKSSTRILEHSALPPEWYTQYWETLEDVAMHVALLYPQMLQATLCADPRHGLCLKVGLIIALAAQVELHRMPGTYHSESRQKSLSVILEVISLTKGLKDEDYVMLEPILGVCFTLVANALRSDRELLIGVSTSQREPDQREQEAFSVLIASAQQLSTKVPYIEHSLQTLCEIASGS